jgi:CCR4-NOT transcription complex subunit 2
VQNTNIDSSFGKPGAIRESIALNLDPQFQSPNERQNREILGVEGGMGSEYMVPEGMMSSAGVLDNSDPYGLLGLLRVLNMTNRDLNTLASGIDLTTLGLNLSSSDVLYSTFASPFSDTPLRRDAQFQIPQCYFIQPPLPPPVDKMSLFSDETLFYIFYSMPQDALQVAAANELYVPLRSFVLLIWCLD